MAVMSIFSKRNKGKNSDTPLPQSIEIGYHKNKKSVTTYVFECCISSLKPVVFQIYWLQTLRKWKDRFFKRSRDFTLVTCSESHVWKSLTLSQQLAQFCVHTSSVGRDMYFIFHMIPQDHAIEVSCTLMGGSSLQHVTTLEVLVATGILIVKRGKMLYQKHESYKYVLPQQN